MPANPTQLVWTILLWTEWTIVGAAIGLLASVWWSVHRRQWLTERAWFLLGRYKSDKIITEADLQRAWRFRWRRYVGSLGIFVLSLLLGFCIQTLTHPSAIPPEVRSNPLLSAGANVLASHSFLSGVVLIIVASAITFIGILIQARSNVVSKNRQRWINLLKRRLTKILMILVQMEDAMEKRRTVRADLASTDANRYSEKVLVLALNFQSSFVKIKLMLNPKEPDHRELVDLIASTASEIVVTASYQESLLERRDELISLSQKILKREWERVKGIE